MHHVLFYEYVKDVLERRGPYREEHLANIRAAKDAGVITMAGPLGEPPTGAAIVFGEGVDRDRVKAFVEADPYVGGGVVSTWRIEPWTLV